MLYTIYKTIYDNIGNIEKLELVEFDVSEPAIISFCKLYNLQIPKDLKDRVAYNHFAMKII